MRRSDIRFRPWVTWPGMPTDDRRGSPFRARLDDTVDLLLGELRHLDAADVLIGVDVDERDIRLDGWPRADARPRRPGVILWFTAESELFVWPCDTYLDWRANLRAIALTLQALRAVDRYGVSRGRQQYTGWRALPAAGTTTSDTFDEAVQLLAKHGGIPAAEIRREPQAATRAYRRACAAVQGDERAFLQVNLARDLVYALHGQR